MDLLNKIKTSFGVGHLSKSGNLIPYRVNSAKDLKVIFNHFDKYPKLTQKQ